MSEPFVMDWPYVESDMNAWRSWAGKETKMDTDELLKPIHATNNQVFALMAVVKANSAAFTEIRYDLGLCNNQEKVQAVINKVEQALTDLSLGSQKIPPWVKAEPKDVGGAVGYGSGYGQYPIDQPLNPANPVPWPPGYMPPTVEGVKAEPEQTVKGGKK